MARDSSAHSSISTRSCITLAVSSTDNVGTAAITPPTSVEDEASTTTDAPKPEDKLGSRRSVRSRHSIATYNLNVLAGTAKGLNRAVTPKASHRTVSGDTLVEGMDTPSRQLVGDGVKALDLDWQVDELKAVAPEKKKAAGGLARRRSTRLEFVARAAANAVASTTSALGKRGRDAMESGKGKLQDLARGRRDSLRPRDAGKSDAEKVNEQPPEKKRRTASITVDSSQTDVVKAVEKPKPKFKRWLSAGLYVGQERDFNPRLTESKNKMKKALKGSDTMFHSRNKALPLPMFGGERLLRQGRDFRLPFDVFSPIPGRQPKPDEWRKTSMNRFVGDAASVWKKANALPSSKCVCTPEDGCDEQCQNRFMFYECDDTNCNVGSEHCTNRAFADLKERCKSGNKYDIGVEVMLTTNRGHGVRANRCFEPNQIIVEYAGEIITQEECERRMKNEYKKNECYYLMTFHQGMIIDATRGSIARFVNHSCEPNCRMVKWTVAGKPRMALFAGEKGIMTGEELTYDYNFDPFSQRNVQECRCGSSTCRGVLGPKTSERPKAKPTEGVIAGAKRKLQQAITDSAARIEESVPQKKRKIISAAKVAVSKAKATLTNKPKDPASLQVMESRAARAARRTSSSSAVTILSAKGRKVSQRRSTSSLVATISPRRPARGPDSSLQRLASVMKKYPGNGIKDISKLAKSRRSLLAATPATEQARRFELLTPTASDDGDESAEMLNDLGAVSTGGRRSASTKNRAHAASGLRNVAASVRNNVVRSVRGPRRAAAMARMGILGKGIESGSTIKVILNDQ